MVIFIVAVLVIVYFWYASIIKRRNKAQEAFSGIDVQLKKRTDLIPNILKIAKKFMEHEKELLTRITELRTKAVELAGETDPEKIKARFENEQELTSAMGNLMIQVENYPDLKSQETMVTAQQAYMDVEENISAARRFYNAAVTALLNSIQIFPGNVLAGYIGVKPMPFFEADETARKPVDASDFL